MNASTSPCALRNYTSAVRAFLDTTQSPDQVDGSRVADLPASAVGEALHVDLVWNVVNRLANAFGFRLRGDQLHSGTRALHRFGYRFPGFLLAGGDNSDHGGPVENLRHAIFHAAATTDPAHRRAAATGENLTEPWQSYTALVRDASYRITDPDVTRLRSAGHPEDEIFELTVAAAIGAALRSFDAGCRSAPPSPRLA